MNKIDIHSAIDTFVGAKIEEMISSVSSNPFAKLLKPVVKRGADNTLDRYKDKIDGFLSFVSDKDGNIDFEGILKDVIAEFETMESVNIGGATVGQGCVEFEIPIPFSGKSQQFRFTTDDFEELLTLIKDGSKT